MSEIIKISNELLEVEISTLGAQMKSMKRDGKQYLKTNESKRWEDSAPVLFPICGCLKDDKYIYNGKGYTLFGHGFAYKSEFEVEKTEKGRVVFLLKSSDETLKNYPFDFEFRIEYKLTQSTLEIQYKIENTDKKDMYFSIGSHEGYACPEGIEAYSIIFENEETLDISLLDGVLLTGEKKRMIDGTDELTLKYEYYDYVDTLVFENIKSKKLVLKNNETGKEIKVEYPDAENLLIWTAPGERYICIEPWSGLPDFVDTTYDITKKPGIIKLASGESIVNKHSITL